MVLKYEFVLMQLYTDATIFIHVTCILYQFPNSTFPTFLIKILNALAYFLAISKQYLVVFFVFLIINYFLKFHIFVLLFDRLPASE